MAKTKVEHTKKLLVEGNNDLHVASALCGKYNVPENFDVVDCDGIDDLIKDLTLRFMNPSQNEVLGIVIDADFESNTKKRKVLSFLKTKGYDITENLPKEGLIVETENERLPKIGLWTMPDNKNDGMVEDFVVKMVSDGDKLMSEVEDELERIEAKNIQRYKPTQKSKAKIHTFLAWNDEPGTPMGQAITKKVLDNPDSETAKVFVDWMKSLFKEQ